ncbi:hypothetical protein QMG83_03420 [Salinibacterium sp. G-O1]|uniref:hypothetical protein n=1 Tax=Salinibacterium sp. G-O1 TaxID=3046208 RepID=UPI0024B9085C|nr:hypothetical protein [Salinibacterium sp. G-O1]MDJ0334269.1 hypothetical protein [Salinibacterium sp. G-O1]
MNDDIDSLRNRPDDLAMALAHEANNASYAAFEKQYDANASKDVWSHAGDEAALAVLRTADHEAVCRLALIGAQALDALNEDDEDES